MAIIAFDNVRKRLSGRDILDGMCFEIEQGETMVVVGASGTGKSVTLKHMVRLMRPDSGSVFVEGEDIANADHRMVAELRSKIGMLFQSAALINWMTVFDNVALPLVETRKFSKKEREMKVAEALELLGLTGHEGKFPDEISGGMKKRVGLARAIIMKPDILLYDEPTSGLDPVTSRQVDRMISDMQRELGVTSVVVTHDLHSAFNIGDRVMMLHQGKVAACGTPKEFTASDHPSVKDFVDAQFSGINLGELGL
jgi:phospholipid/cholesterol/gamma-HCH transport system ATP-binding protein